MLQTQTVNAELLDLLNKLMAFDIFKGFNLVGGTALALINGHRISIDIDLFGNSEIDELEFANVLNGLGDVTILKKSKNIIIYSINGVKVDFVNYKYPLLEEITVTQNIRMVSEKDIAAMKLNAISGRGSKKDFIDLFVLLEKFTLDEIIGFYKEKYPDGSEFLVLKSLNYFEDADEEAMPIMLINDQWPEIKQMIKAVTEEYVRKL
jgi:Nucleotidyl transferase AbiEii toxin, Type IV TA system